MDLLEIIKQTRNVERYDNKDVSVDLIEQIMESVQFTQSAANTQPWEVYLVKDISVKQLLDDCLLEPMLRGPAESTTISSAPAALVIAMDRKRARARYGESGEKLYALQDTAVAVNNLRLMATARGLGTAWIREADLGKVAVVLNLPALIKPVALLTVGYALTFQQAPDPLKLPDIFHRTR